MILDKIKEMGDNLKLLEGHDRLHYLIDKAREVESLPDAAKTEDNRIRGCASKLWIIGGVRDDGTMMYQVDGDAHISKGTAKVVTDLVNGEHRSAVANLTVEDFYQWSCDYFVMHAYFETLEDLKVILKISIEEDENDLRIFEYARQLLKRTKILN